MKSIFVVVAFTVAFWVVPPASADQAPSVTVRVRSAVRHLPIALDSHEASYDRDRFFGDWIEQGQGCDTRAVVLQMESTIPITQSDACTILTGRWRSYYDATTYSLASDLQVDHVVPVKNVWITGGWAWTQATRVAYYNDLADPRTLVAVDAHDNESKGDQTPDEWLPRRSDCRYIREFVAVKLRWMLTVTRPEKRALRSEASTCRNVQITYAPASIERVAKTRGWCLVEEGRPCRKDQCLM